jgi:predicted DNA-binding transcriptional regulator YafY
MPINKNAYIRYQALDKCFRNRGRRYFIEGLIDACSAALEEYDGRKQGIKRRQVFDDIRFMESEQGWAILLERHKDGKRIYYRYQDISFSIANRSLNEIESSQLKETMVMLSRFQGRPQFEWLEPMMAKLEIGFRIKGNAIGAVSFEENRYLKGIEYFGALFNAITERNPLEIQYSTFKGNKVQYSTFYPYQLKEYNKRWFLIGRSAEYQTLSVLPLDRIEAIEELQLRFEPCEVDLEEFFEDIIGVTKPKETVAKKIVLMVEENLWPYLESKPLHGSQKRRASTDGKLTVEMEVIPNYELEQLLLSYGEGIVVLAPQTLVDRLSSRVQAMASNYFPSVREHCTDANEL